jgi:hypothetical protein
MSSGINIPPSLVIYSKIDTGDGYKSYAVNSVTLPAGAAFIRAKVQLQTARQKLAVFVNGVIADHSFTVTQQGRTVELVNKTDFSAFTQPIIITFSLSK